MGQLGYLREINFSLKTAATSTTISIKVLSCFGTILGLSMLSLVAIHSHGHKENTRAAIGT